MVDGAAEETLDVILEREETIRAVGVAPVDDVDILAARQQVAHDRLVGLQVDHVRPVDQCVADQQRHLRRGLAFAPVRSEEHTSELQSLMRLSYAVFCLKKQKTT